VLCPACARENPLGARYCNECATPLAPVCAGCGARNPPDANFCGQCAGPLAGASLTSRTPERSPRDYTPKHLAEKILQSKSVLEGERKQVTVLFADVKSSLALAESVDPEEWHRILERFFQILADGVHRFEGTINQYTGDGIMALFGAPIAHEDHAQRACYAALHLQGELRRYAEEVKRTRELSFAVRLGLNSGEVVVGKIGDDLRMDYTAQGPVVGVAQRMEQLADPGLVYVADPTAKLVAGYFAMRDLGSFELKGLRERIRVHELESAGRVHTRFEVSRARGLSKFVGRADEMAALEAALARAREGNGQVVGIVAQPGVGKSRLCFELLERCRAQGIPPLEGRALAHGRNVPFLTILQVFRAYYGITDQDSDRAAREKIAGRLLLLDESFREDLPLLFEFHGVGDPERPAPEMDPELRQRRLFAVLRRLVREGRGGGEVGIALLEDLHWLDGGSASFLEQWVDALAGTRNLLLVNFRPEYHAAWMQRSWYQQLPLSPLGPEATRELLRDLLGPHASVAGLAEAIHSRTAGNPFFAEEVVQSLVESGQLEGTKGRYRLARPVEEIAVPATVQSLLAARIDRLAEREKQILHCAAVIGRDFSLPILQQIANLPERELTEALSRLEAAELVFAQSLYPVAEYAFKHVLTQEVAYAAQLGERRRLLHAAVARAMEEVDATRFDERAALLAHHFEQAGEALEAARWHRRAADFAARSDLVEARSHWARAHALLAALPSSPERDGLLLRACVLLLDLGWRVGIPAVEADALFAEGQALADVARDPRGLAQLHLAYGYVLSHAGADEDSRLRQIRMAFEVASRIPDERLRASLELRALAQLSYAHFHLGRPREGLEGAERALSTAAAAGGPRRSNAYAFALNTHGMNLLLLGRLAEARLDLERGAATARELGDLDGEFSAHLWHTFLAWFAGDAEECLAHGRALIELPRRFGTGALARIGMAHLLASRWEAATDSLSQSVEITRKAGTGLQYLALHLALLADAQLGSGLRSEARASADEALASAQRQGLRGYECLARIALARILRTTEGAAARAAIESQLDASAAIVEETGAVVYAPFVLEERAALSRLQGDEVRWERELREAQRLFAEMGAPIRAEQISRELGP
jgi:class 3 adenylate cyclase/tetratricopeptide (TPR) repeat protein